MDQFAREKNKSTYAARVEALLSQMTLEEKVGQTVLANAGAADIEARVQSGQVGSVICTDVKWNNQLQRAAMKGSPLADSFADWCRCDPRLPHHIPHSVSESCSWNPELLERASAAAAAEAATSGANWIYAPMVDISRDPRWGRIAEGAGEDPFLGRAIAQARVRGFQSSPLPGGRHMAACPKHYAGYGFAEAGRDYNTVDISERTFARGLLATFQSSV